MTEPAFTRDGTTDLYWADPAARTAAFLATDPDTLGPAPTLTATWGDTGGGYVFLGAPAGASFPADLLAWLRDYRPEGPPRFLWVLDPGQPPTAWVTTELTVADGRTGGANFPLADYQLAVSGGSGIAPGEAPDGGWGFLLADTGEAPALTLYSPVDLFPSAPGTSLLGIGAGTAGAWRFVLDAPAGSGDVFARLGAGVRYFTPGEGGYVNVVHFGAVSQPVTAPVTFYAQVDPLRPFDRERTALGFFSPSGTGTPPALPSGYATAHGHGITLRPEAGARLVFGFAPYFVDEQAAGGYYFVPDGPFSIAVVAPEGGVTATGIDRVVCGTSGLEYLGIPLTGGCALTFVPDQPAYAPLGTATTGADALTGHGTTSWVTVSSPPATPVYYYSQPEDAPLFAAPPAGSNLADGAFDLLDFFELPAATLPGTAAAAAAAGGVAAAPVPFPMAPFRGLALGSVRDAVAIEQLALAPRRRAALVTAPPPPHASLADTAAVGVTPQGLGVGVGTDADTWTWLGIGHTGDLAREPDLRFTRVTGRFRQAMQTNNLFAVLGNATEFAPYGSVEYLLTADAVDVIATIPGAVTPAVIEAVRASGVVGTTYPDRSAFAAALPAMTPDEQGYFLRYAGLLTPVVGGWPFRLSPDSWGTGTYLLLKFVLGRSVADLVGDVSTWAWPEAASATGDPADAQRAIADTIAAVRDVPASSPYANFRDVVTDPNWTGVLALSVDVPLDQLPSELQVLAAGIDPAQFRAHHFGMSVTPYKLSGGTIGFEQSSMFGLIDYQNPEDQYFSENIPYAFRVLQLTVGIRNSVVTTFTSRAELLVNRLFGAGARLLPTEHGNNVILDGAHQQQTLPDGTTHDTYVFSMTGDSTFQLDGVVLQSVELLGMQLVTAKASDPPSGSATVDAVFQMSGNLRFFEPEGFDPFCWGDTPLGERSALRFGNLGIAMTFELGDPAGTTRFTLRDGNLSFDAANSVPRAGSLVARFPVRLSGLVATADPVLSPGAPPQTPADLGFVSVTAPIEQAVLTQPWYGLDYTIDLGTLGALAGSKALAIQVLVAWSPGADGGDPSVYLGVKLPGAKGGLGVSLPLQGVVTMGFKGIEFIVDDQPGVERTYTLRMRDFALRLLGLAFPPGHNDVILFGNPDQSGSSKVGWYMAYASAADPKRPAPPPTRVEVARRRPTLRGTGG